MVWFADGSPGMAGGNVTVSHISRCIVHIVVQNNMQTTVTFGFQFQNRLKIRILMHRNRLKTM